MVSARYDDNILSINNSLESFSRKNKLFKLWHLNGSFESYSNQQVLLSFYELDEPTKVELNTVKIMTKSKHNALMNAPIF